MQKQKLHQAHLAKWAVRFSDQRACGLTVRHWCDQNHVSIHKYNYWKHQMKKEVVNQVLPDIIPLPVTTPLSVTEPALPQNNQSDQTVLDRPVRANRTNIRLCVDGVSIKLEYARIMELLHPDNDFDDLPSGDRLKQRQLVLKKKVDAYFERVKPINIVCHCYFLFNFRFYLLSLSLVRTSPAMMTSLYEHSF